eukprot:jgi/Hompol1/5371/HPOL_001197-RA
MSRIEPMVSNQLLQNVKSTAFHGYTVNWEDTVESISCEFTLTHVNRFSETGCTALSWNKTGSTIAAAYGRVDHTSWCSHKGMICTWNTSQRDLNPEIASFSAETTSCVMCIAFHPELPSLIVGGLFNGEIVVWQIADQQDSVKAISKPSDLAHQEPVSNVRWIKTDKPGVYHIVSTGNDGKVLIWDLENNLEMPKAMQVYRYTSTPLLSKVMLSHIPKHQRSKQSASAQKLDTSIGITALSTSKYHSQECLLGTEIGHVLKCSMVSVAQASNQKPQIMDKPGNPVLLAFGMHVGPVQWISCSPFHRNLFLSCASDGAMHLYSQLQTKPVWMWEPSTHTLCSVDWSPFRSTVFACTTLEGSVLIYDLATSKSIPSATIKVSSQPGDNMTLCHFNPKRPEYLATGDAFGVIKIWRLSTQLSVGSSTSNDNILDQLSIIA